MDKYIDADRVAVASTFGTIKERVDKAAESEGTLEGFINTLCSCVRDLEVLRFKLLHMEDNKDFPGGMTDMVDPNPAVGVSIMRNKFKELSKELQESITDTSWVEDIDAFKESQQGMLKQLNDIINSIEYTEDQKAQAEAMRSTLDAKTPKQDTPEWLVRKMKADITVMGLQSALVSSIVDALRI